MRKQFASSSVRRVACQVIWGVALAALPVVSFAQTPGTDPDWAAAATAVKSGLTPILTVVLPIAVTIMLLMMGWRFFKKLIKSAG